MSNTVIFATLFAVTKQIFFLTCQFIVRRDHVRMCNRIWTVSVKRAGGGCSKEWPLRSPDVISMYSVLHDATLTLILRRSRTGTVWFYTSTSNKRAARPKLYTKSLTRALKLMYSCLTLVRISINL